jgi:hypothetical protein
MSRYIDPFPQYTHEGRIVSNGRLYFLEPNTTGFNTSDFKDTWVDPGFAALNTNPIALDGDGRVPDIFLQGNYRVVLYTQGGVDEGELVFDIDNYEGSPISEQFGDWSNTTNYGLNDYVSGSDGFIYRSLQNNNLNHNPINSAAWWTQIAFISIYNANETYAQNAVVMYQGILYTSLVNNNLNNTPSGSPSQWQSFSGSVAAVDVAYDNTGTGLSAATAQAAITELQAEKQPLDDDLTAIAALVTAAFGRSLLTGADAAGILTILGITSTVAELNFTDGVTSSIQSQLNAKQNTDAELTALAGLVSAANKVPMFSGAGAATLLDLKTDGTMATAVNTDLYSGLAVKTYVDTAVAAGVTPEVVEDYVGAMVTGNTETRIVVTYDDGTGKLNFVVDGNLSSYTNDAGFYNTAEAIQDIVGAMLTGNTETRIAATYDDVNNVLNFVVEPNLSNYTIDAGFQESIEDVVGGMVSGNTETLIAVTYDDGANKLNFIVDQNLSSYTIDAGFTESLQDVVGAMFSGNTETGVTVTYQDADGTIDVEVAVDLSTAQVTGTLPESKGGTGATALSQIEITQLNVTSSTSDPSGTPVDGQMWIKREA